MSAAAPAAVPVLTAPAAAGAVAQWRRHLGEAPDGAVVALVEGALLDPADLDRAVPLLVAALARPAVPFAEPVTRLVHEGAPWARRTPGGRVLAARRADLGAVLDEVASADPAGGLEAVARALVARLPGAGVLVEAMVRVPATDEVPVSRAPRPPLEAAAGPRELPEFDDAVRRWSVRTAVPFYAHRESWGDLHYARALAGALRRRARAVTVDYRDSVDRAGAAGDDVVVVLRGLERLDPPEHAIGILWVISHPELVTDEELRGYDVVVAAGPRWAAETTARTGVPVVPLLQATDARRFRPGPPDGPPTDVLFVGNSRRVRRPVLDDALAAGADVTVYGEGWAEVLPGLEVAERYLDNRELPAAYRSASVVLNDHWPEMAEGGFVSNRLFDAVASGARVLSDEVAGLPGGLGALFGGAVRTYRVGDVDRVRALLSAPAHAWPGVAERRSIAERVRLDHGFDARAGALLDLARAAATRTVPL